jgi:RimJ/RimL family protein N-acetyltransferase
MHDMENERDIGYKCTKETFRPAIIHPVRWLDWEQDLDIAKQLWEMEERAFRQMWNEAKEQGYQFCAVVEEGRIVARAALWRYSETAWELAAVYVLEEYQEQGYGKSVCSFATQAVLESVPIATCHTRANNLAMQKTAESLGFQPMD